MGRRWVEAWPGRPDEGPARWWRWALLLAFGGALGSAGRCRGAIAALSSARPLPAVGALPRGVFRVPHAAFQAEPRPVLAVAKLAPQPAVAEQLPPEGVPPLKSAFAITHRWVVPEALGGQPLPAVLRALDAAAFPSATAARRACRQRCVFVNSRVAACDTPVAAGDAVTLQARVRPAAPPSRPAPPPPGLAVLWEDGHLAAVVKPRGLAVFREDCDDNPACVKQFLPSLLRPAPDASDPAALPGPPKANAWARKWANYRRCWLAGGRAVLLAAWVADWLAGAPAALLTGVMVTSGVVCRMAGIGSGSVARPPHAAPAQPRAAPLHRPQPAHRLDKATGGLLLVAKTRPALSNLCEAFETRAVDKEYVALVCGRLQGRGVVDTPLDGKPAETAWEAVRGTDALTVVRLTPKTGRTHQLRRHLKSIGHSIVGDRKYGMADPQGMFLWAVALGVPHPVTGERLSFRLPEPPEVGRYLGGGGGPEGAGGGLCRTLAQ